jgi:hypothetical protein
MQTDQILGSARRWVWHSAARKMFFREEIYTKLPSYTRAAAASGFQVVARCDHILERPTWGDPGEYVSTSASKKMIDSRRGSEEQSAKRSNSHDP